MFALFCLLVFPLIFFSHNIMLEDLCSIRLQEMSWHLLTWRLRTPKQLRSTLTWYHC